MLKAAGNRICVTVEPGTKKIYGPAGESLINLLAEDGIVLRSDCGGKGVCKKCNVEILSAATSCSATVPACSCIADKDLSIQIPESSLMKTQVLRKARLVFPDSFHAGSGPVGTGGHLGLAVDIGTTTIAMYLCDIPTRTVLSSTAVKNPQSLCGDDVLSRIGYIGKSDEHLARLQRMVTKAISKGGQELLRSAGVDSERLNTTVVVGNPTMIHVLLGILPYSIGVAPYTPAFYDARREKSDPFFPDLPDMDLYTFPQISGFLGGDILAAALAAELDSYPRGSLLIDLGTNGELMLKGKGKMYATSCATGPAFEGASLSCGIQAVPEAINRVTLKEGEHAAFSLVSGNSGTSQVPSGICGTGIISAVAAFLSSGLIDKTGAFTSTDLFPGLQRPGKGGKFTLYDDGKGNEVSISQQDIRSLQLGKAALRTGIELLLESAGIAQPEAIIVAGAFGTNAEKSDLLTLGMIPDISPDNIHVIGNSAGAGAVMALCEEGYLTHAKALARCTVDVQLAEIPSFQDTFVSNLGFY